MTSLAFCQRAYDTSYLPSGVRCGNYLVTGSTTTATWVKVSELRDLNRIVKHGVEAVSEYVVQ